MIRSTRVSEGIKKIKLVRIISRLNIGGPARHVKLLSQGLSDQYETTLITGSVASPESDMSYILNQDKLRFRHVHIPELGRKLHPIKDLIAFVKILRLLIQIKPDIVATHASKAGLLGRITAFISRVPVRTHTFHGNVFENYFGKQTSRVIIWVERLLAHLTTTIIAISPKQKDALVHRYKLAPPHKVKIVRLGFDLAPFINISRHVPRKKIYVGIVGRLAPIKNHRLFLEIASQIFKKRNDTQFVIVGSGECEKELQDYASALNILDAVSFVGNQSDLSRVYSLLDIVALTSKNEGTPASLIEAQASGLPVITTDVGGVKDIVHHEKSGFIIALNHPGHKDAFVQALIKLLDNTHLRHEMGAYGKRFVLNLYDKKILLKNTDRLYNSLII